MINIILCSGGTRFQSAVKYNKIFHDQQFIVLNEVYRFENPSKVDVAVALVESQVSSYLGEDNLKRVS